jgi:hypothetical protein
MFSVLNAGTTLGGSIWGMTLDSAGNPYLVTQNIVVPVGKTLNNNKGCVFLFKPFTGISVDGSIDVNGTREHPVVFTTENDSSYNFNTTQAANPFDWNGIHITDKANHALFRNFLVSYTVFGLKCQTENISIENGVFFQNGQFHFTINEKIQWVQEGFRSRIISGEKTVQNKSMSSYKRHSSDLGMCRAYFCIFSGLSVKNYTTFKKNLTNCRF